jgi:hypothetical protein
MERPAEIIPPAVWIGRRPKMGAIFPFNQYSSIAGLKSAALGDYRTANPR